MAIESTTQNKRFSGVINGAALASVSSDDVQTQRFYPEQMPVFAFEPTREKFKISHINEGVGEGVVSLVEFKTGEVLFACTGFITEEVTQFSLQLAEGVHLHDPYFYGKLLHSCDPNTYVDLKTRRFIALKPIAANEFVTLDYTQTEDFLFRGFYCDCGASNCKGHVVGRRQ